MMTCLSKNEPLSRNDKSPELLAGYLAKRLDPVQMAEMDRHFAECAECRGFLTVWERLDDFAAPEVTPGFDARLYARIAAEEARRSWWRRLIWRPAIPLAAAAALMAMALFIYTPGQTPRRPDVAKPVNIEQVAQAVDDLDLLVSLDR